MRAGTLLISVILLIFNGCGQKVDMEAEMTNIKRVIDQFEEFWEIEDLELLAKIVAHDKDMINIGSESTEYFVGWDNLKTSIEQMLPALENINISVKDQNIVLAPSGDIAWFSEIWSWDLLYQGTEVQFNDQRLTGVLAKRNGAWVIVQFHNSSPTGG